MPAQTPLQVALPSFESAAAVVMSELQASLSQLVESLPESIRRAVDLERALRLEKKLAWQVFRLSRTSDLAETANVPSLTAAARVIDAARKRGVPEPTLHRVLEAFEKFENFALDHGGDRAGLISMISGLTGEKSELYELNIRRSLFRGHAHAWGVQARLAIRTGIFVPHTQGAQRTEDCAMVIGDIGLQRRRQADPLRMLWWLQSTEEPTHAVQPSPERGTSEVKHALELLPQFSSQPLPRMVPVPGNDGTGETELVFPPGRASATTLYSTQLYENIASHPDAPFFGQTMFTMPLETMVWEILVEVGWSDPSTARAAVYGRRHHPEKVYEQRLVDLMPQHESLDYLGTHDRLPPLPGASDHPDAVHHALAKAGWLGKRFDVYRCRVQFPLMFSMLLVRVEAMRDPPRS